MEIRNMESVLPVDHDIVMKTIDTDFENEIIDPSVLDDMELYLECEDDELNFIPASKQTNFLRKNVKLRVTFSPGTSDETLAACSRKRFTCSVCDQTFHTETKFRSHMTDMHEMKKPLKCGSCSLLYSSVKMLKRHYLLKHKSLNLMGENLPVTSVDEGQKHSTSTTQYHSDKCLYITANGESPQTDVSSVYKTSSMRSYTCDKCSFKCKQKGTYMLHTRMHKNCFKEHLCEVCGKNFLSYTQLSRHSKIHTTYKNYKCMYQGCNQSFKFQGALTDHIKTVHNKRIKTVDKLSKVSASKPRDILDLKFLLKEKYKRISSSPGSSLVHSVSSEDQHGDSSGHRNLFSKANTKYNKNFMCTWPDCGKCFRDNFNLKHHMYTHTKTKTNTCPYCDFTYIQKASLNWHLKNKHGKNEDGHRAVEHENTLTDNLRTVAEKTNVENKLPLEDDDYVVSEKAGLNATCDFVEPDSDSIQKEGSISVVNTRGHDTVLHRLRQKLTSSDSLNNCYFEKYTELSPSVHDSQVSLKDVEDHDNDIYNCHLEKTIECKNSPNNLQLSNDHVNYSNKHMNHSIECTELNRSREKHLQISTDNVQDSSIDATGNTESVNDNDHQISIKHLKRGDSNIDVYHSRIHTECKSLSDHGLQIPVEEDICDTVDKEKLNEDNIKRHSRIVKKAIPNNDLALVNNKKSKKSSTKNFLCTWPNCGKSFRDNFNLKSHYCTHTEMKTRVCPHCDFTYIQKSSLNWHLKSKHVIQ